MLDRRLLEQGWAERLLQGQAPEDHGVWPEERLAASREAFLRGHPPGEDLWVFGYGSLIWNPTFAFAERRRGLVKGVHRSFCLWTRMGRGTSEEPGLVLGLEPGGTCRGVFFRVAAEDLDDELPLLWRREMITGAYRPAWLQGWCLEENGRKLRALGFKIDRAHPRYTGKIPHERRVRALALAEGPLGPARGYLYSTAEHLDELGIADGALHKLALDVRAYRATIIEVGETERDGA